MKGIFPQGGGLADRSTRMVLACVSSWRVFIKGFVRAGIPSFQESTHVNTKGLVGGHYYPDSPTSNPRTFCVRRIQNDVLGKCRFYVTRSTRSVRRLVSKSRKEKVGTKRVALTSPSRTFGKRTPPLSRKHEGENKKM